VKKYSIWFVVISVFFVMAKDAEAGGAAARRRPMGNPQAAQQAEMQKRKQAQALQQQQQPYDGPVEEMEFDALWEGLAVSSKIWPELVDHEIKVLVVQTYFDWYREQGIFIQKPAENYVSLLDVMAGQNVGIFERTFQDVMMFVAVMEYDFDNGMNKDELAYKLLGPAFYEQNKKRLGG
jgi:hypothetical protein